MNQPTRRSRNESKRATREALIQAGLDEWIENGSETSSLDAICARAGLTRGAFYVHFKDREDFFVAVMQDALDGVLDALLGPEPDDIEMGDAVRNFLDFISTGCFPAPGPRDLPVHRLIDACVRYDVVRHNLSRLLEVTTRRLGERLEVAQRKGAARSDVDARASASLVTLLGLGGLVCAAVRHPVDQAGLHQLLSRLLDASHAES